SNLIPASSLWQIRRLADGFTYRFGSSPRLPNGDWAFAQPGFEDGNWRKMARPGSDLMGNGQHEMWARIRLSGAGLTKPLLFLRSAGSDLEAYVDGKPIPRQAVTDHYLEKRLSHEKHFLLYPGVHEADHLLTLRLR